MRRPRTSPEEQYRLVMDCRQSGLSDARWCEENGIQPSTFYNWVIRLRKKGMYGKIQEQKRNGFNKSQVARNLQINRLRMPLAIGS